MNKIAEHKFHIAFNNITIMGVYDGQFQITFNNITIMGMNKNNEHNNIELEQNNNIIKWTRIMNMKNLN